MHEVGGRWVGSNKLVELKQKNKKKTLHFRDRKQTRGWGIPWWSSG